MKKLYYVFIFLFIASSGFLVYVSATQAYLQGKVDAYREQAFMEKDYARFQRRTGVCTNDTLAVFVARMRAECKGI